MCDDSNCFGGYCIEGECSCTYYSGPDCSVSYLEEIGFAFFQVWRALILLNFASVAIYTFYQLERKRRSEHRVTLNLGFVAYMLVPLHSLVRILYYAIDPWNVNLNVSVRATVFLYVYAFPILFAIYFLVLLGWIDAYHAQHTRSEGSPFKRIGPVFLVIMIVLLAVMIPLTVLDTSYMYLIFYAYLCLVALVISVGFIIYGTLIYRRLNQVSHIASHANDRIKKITTFTLGSSVTLLVACISLIIITISGAESYPWPTLFSYTLNAVIETVLCVLVVKAFSVKETTSSGRSTDPSRISEGVELTQSSSSEKLSGPVDLP